METSDAQAQDSFASAIRKAVHKGQRNMKEENFFWISRKPNRKSHFQIKALSNRAAVVRTVGLPR